MEMKKEKEKVNIKGRPVWVSLFAGALAGAVAKTTIAPFDRTKINFQISNTPYTMRGAFQFLEHSYKTEGILSLWRGNSATMARIVPYAAIQFTAHEQWKRFFGVDHHHVKDDPKRRFAAGALAGITSQSLTYPLDLARARMAITQKHQYSTLKEVFVRIIHDEGPKALFRGYVPTALGVVPYAGTSFFTYGTLKRWHRENNYPNSTLFNLAAGGVSGMVAQTTSYPLDIVRRRMQTAAVVGTEHKYKTVLSTFIHIYREEGIKGGFFKGLSMNWIKGPIAVGTSFATYDFVMETFKQQLEPDCCWSRNSEGGCLSQCQEHYLQAARLNIQFLPKRPVGDFAQGTSEEVLGFPELPRSANLRIYPPSYPSLIWES